MTHSKTILSTLILGLFLTAAATAADNKPDYRILSTSRTSTMEKELNQAAAAGYRFVKVTNTPNVFGGKELVVLTVKNSGTTDAEARSYKVLSARGTSDLEKKLKSAANEGYAYLDETTMPNSFGGTNTVVIVERKEPRE